jgi:hypothetical protein
MNKIPVENTISRSYGFAFSNILSVFGIAWLPYLMLVAIAVGLVFLLAPDLPRMLIQGDFDPVVLLHVSHIFGLLGLLSFIVTCMVTVGIQRKALGKHPGPVFVSFSLGAPVWRLAGALFLAGLVILFIALLTGAVAGVIWWAAGRFLPNFELLIRTIAVVAACLWLIYMSVRLTFFLPAVVVAEEGIGLGRAWELAEGNFWRIFIVFVAVFLPVAIGFGIVSSALFGPFFEMAHFHGGMDFHEIMHAVFQHMRVVGPLMIIYQMVERIVFLGLGNGMIANAYLAVTGVPAGAAATASQQSA